MYHRQEKPEVNALEKEAKKITWNAFKHRSASLEAGWQWFLRTLWGQGARFARRRSRFHPLTPQLARQDSNIAFDEAEPAAKAVWVGGS
ncbi:hypothetical protein AEM38_08080 [Hyphomonadaceae bacterium UKL13-1]|nr:hypothetical protein AEM38_08080 [Hyphomonadaceae bacterium UKL13-1]